MLADRNAGRRAGARTDGLQDGTQSLDRLLCIINAASGRRRGREAARQLQTIVAASGIALEIRIARHGRELPDLARKAVDEGWRTIIAGGGDGTINAVATALVGTDVIMGVLPLGTFNYFARNLGIPLDVESAARVWLDGNTHAVPVGEVNGQVFLNNASLGLYPAVLAMRERVYRRWGRSQLAAHWSVLLAIVRRRAPLSLSLHMPDGETFTETSLVFAACNVFQIESFSLPGAECVRSGELAFYVAPRASRLALAALSLRLLWRQLRPGVDFTSACAPAARLNTRHKRRLTVAIDGERRVIAAPLVVQLRPAALRVLVPRIASDGKQHSAHSLGVSTIDPCTHTEWGGLPPR